MRQTRFPTAPPNYCSKEAYAFLGPMKYGRTMRAYNITLLLLQLKQIQNVRQTVVRQRAWKRTQERTRRVMRTVCAFARDLVLLVMLKGIFHAISLLLEKATWVSGTIWSCSKFNRLSCVVWLRCALCANCVWWWRRRDGWPRASCVMACCLLSCSYCDTLQYSC